MDAETILMSSSGEERSSALLTPPCLASTRKRITLKYQFITSFHCQDATTLSKYYTALTDHSFQLPQKCVVAGLRAQIPMWVLCC